MCGQPCQCLWVTDISEFKYGVGEDDKKGKLYLSVILDLCDRRPVAFVYSTRNDNPLVFDTFANPFFNATSNEVLQTRLKQYFMKYNHEIATRSSRFNYMYGMVLGYELEGKIRQEPIIAGYLSNSLFYESSKKEMEET